MSLSVTIRIVSSLLAPCGAVVTADEPQMLLPLPRVTGIWYKLPLLPLDKRGEPICRELENLPATCQSGGERIKVIQPKCEDQNGKK